MASGTIYGSTDNRYIESAIDYTTSMDIASNRTWVTAALFYRRTNSGYTTKGNGNFSVTINGDTRSTQTYATITENGWTKVIEHGTWVYHNDDGQKWIEIGGSGGIPGTTFSSTAIGSGLTLDQIPRKSEVSLSTSEQEIGKTIVIYTNRKSASFSHTVWCGFGSLDKTIASGVGDAVEWTLPEELASQIPDHTNGWGNIHLDTYDSGGNHIGSSQTRFTAVIPASAVPKLKSITIKRIDGAVPSSWGVYVKGKSKIECTFHNAEGTLYSPVREYIVDGAGSSNTNVVTSGFLSKAGTNEFRAYVKDSRGRTSDAKSVSIEVLDYYTPFLSGFTALRCDADENPMEEGDHLKFSCTYDAAPVGNNNIVNGVFYYRKKGQTAWGQAGTFTKKITSAAGSLYTSTAVINNISADYSYECRVVITDSLGESAEKTFLVQTPDVVIDFKMGGHGVAIGKVAEEEDTMEIAWKSHFSKHLCLDNGIAVMGKDTLDNAEIPLVYRSFKNDVEIGTAQNENSGNIYLNLPPSREAYVYKNGTGGVIYRGGEDLKLNNKQIIWAKDTDGNDRQLIYRDRDDCINIGTSSFYSSGSIYFNLNPGRELYVYNGGQQEKVWNGFNHGSGSGMNADLLDGHHSDYFLDVSGSITALVSQGSYLHVSTTKGAYGVDWWESDRKLKENISDSEVEALSLVNQIRHRQFDWKKNGKHEALGYVAQELEELESGFVFRIEQKDGEENCQISANKLVPYLSKAIQELSLKYDRLNQEFEAFRQAANTGGKTNDS